MKISEMITDRYKLRISPTVYYDLLADVQEVEEEQEPTTKNDSSKYCDRNICLRNEYNNVGCEDCEVTKSQEQTTKNDLGVDCIKKSDAINIIQDMHGLARVDVISDAVNRIITMPSVTPQEPQTFKWCTDCKEYDQEKHCCHRWTNVIRDTVEEMKEEYIEREVLDKIRAELHATAEMHEDGDYYLRDEWIDEYFNKYKAESEE